jgi:hypothetical protein
MDKAATFKQETPGHEPKTGLDTKIQRLTDRQWQFEFDFEPERLQ